MTASRLTTAARCVLIVVIVIGIFHASAAMARLWMWSVDWLDCRAVTVAACIIGVLSSTSLIGAAWFIHLSADDEDY